MSGVTVETVTDIGHLRRAAHITALVWGRSEEGQPVTTELLAAAVHAGGHVGLARDGERDLGMSFALATRDPGVLHSHVVAVVADARGRGVGRALKFHQRRWSLDHGVHTLRWTFDPLQRANAVFNLKVLGATVDGYTADFYGPMRNALNAGDPSDRLMVRWDLEGGPSGVPDAARAQPLLAADGDEVEPALAAADATAYTCPTPADIAALHADRPALAARWRELVREVLAPRLRSGRYEITGITAEGSYLLVRC